MPDTDWARHALPGSSLVFYMGIGAAAEIQTSLLSKGVPADTQVTVAADVSKPSERIVTTRLADLAEDIASTGITGNALLMLTIPFDAAARKPTVPPTLRVTA